MHKHGQCCRAESVCPSVHLFVPHVCVLSVETNKYIFKNGLVTRRWKKVSGYDYSFWQNAPTCETDGQTDGRTSHDGIGRSAKICSTRHSRHTRPGIGTLCMVFMWSKAGIFRNRRPDGQNTGGYRVPQTVADRLLSRW